MYRMSGSCKTVGQVSPNQFLVVSALIFLMAVEVRFSTANLKWRNSTM